MPTLIQIHRLGSDLLPEHFAELEVTAIPRIDEKVKLDYVVYRVADVIHDYDTDDIIVILEKS